MDLEAIMLSEVSQTEMDKKCMISLMWDIKQKATNEQIKQTYKKTDTDTDNRMVVIKGEGGWEENKEDKGVNLRWWKC